MQKDRWCVWNVPIGSEWTDIAVPPQMSWGCNMIRMRPSVDMVFGDDSDSSFQDGARAQVEKVIGDPVCNSFRLGKTTTAYCRFDPGEVICRVKAASGSGVVTVEYLR